MEEERGGGRGRKRNKKNEEMCSVCSQKIIKFYCLQFKRIIRIVSKKKAKEKIERKMRKISNFQGKKKRRNASKNFYKQIAVSVFVSLFFLVFNKLKIDKWQKCCWNCSNCSKCIKSLLDQFYSFIYLFAYFFAYLFYIAKFCWRILYTTD